MQHIEHQIGLGLDSLPKIEHRGSLKQSAGPACSLVARYLPSRGPDE